MPRIRTTAGAVLQGSLGDMSSQAVVAVDGPQPGPSGSVRLRLVGSPTMSVQQSAGCAVVEEFANASYATLGAAADWHSSNSAVAAIVERSGHRSGRPWLEERCGHH